MAEENSAITTVFSTMIKSRVSANTSPYQCHVKPSKPCIVSPLLKE